MSDPMLRRLLKKRLSEGATGEAIRAELTGLGLDDGEIALLVNEVSQANSGPSALEQIWAWLPLVLLALGAIGLGILALLVERPVLAAACMVTGALLSVGSLLVMFAAALARGHVRYGGGVRNRHWQVDILGAVTAEPGRYSGVFGMMIAGVVLIVLGFAIEPQAIQKLRNKDGTSETRE